MEISEPSISIFFVSKFLALAPYSVRKNSKGVYTIDRSVPFSFYASALASVMVFLTYRGLLLDSSSKIPVSASATSKVVRAMDVSVVVMTITAGVICGLVGLNATRDLNMRLKKVDESLGSITNLKTERLKAVLMLTIPMITMSILLVLDVCTWLRYAGKTQFGGENAALNVQWYISFYSLYFIFTGLHINFANTTLGLARRFQTLNSMLKTSYLPADGNKTLKTQEKLKITTVKTTTLNTPNLHDSLSKLASESYRKVASESYQDSGKNKSMLLKVLAECHETLGECVNIVSSAYGMAVLFILISGLLHLVATFYFLFIELLSKKDNGYVLQQIVWILFHSCRLLMIVEPCHRVTRESRKTILIVSKIERTVHDSILIEELASAIATYLVIFMQFQSSNG